ncbi:MAG: hypothetical protein IT219_11455 [Bacteroidales bacterium]|nr:hypothetical protein [Bacteroidales bacterium]
MKRLVFISLLALHCVASDPKPVGFVKKEIEIRLERHYYPQDLDWRFGKSLDSFNFHPNLLVMLSVTSNIPDTLYMEAFICNEFKSTYVDAYVVENQNNDWILHKIQPMELPSTEKILISPGWWEYFMVGIGPLNNGDCILIQPRIEFPPNYIRSPAFGGQFAFIREPYAFFRYFDDATDVFLPDFEDCTDSMTMEIRKALGE